MTAVRLQDKNGNNITVSVEGWTCVYPEVATVKNKVTTYTCDVQLVGVAVPITLSGRHDWLVHALCGHDASLVVKHR